MPNWGSKYIPAEGPKTAKVVIVGEAPGETEEREGRPFVGTSGKVLDGLLNDAGINRSEVYITNVVKYRPKGNIFNNFYDFVEIPNPKGKGKPKKRRVKSIALVEGEMELDQELKEIKPHVIICLGNEALYAVTGRSGITTLRGSILESKYGKVIPTYHPAAILRQWSWRPIALFDLQRAQEESAFPEVVLPQRTLLSSPDYATIMQELNRLCSGTKPVAFDIEVMTGQITCIGFSDSPNWAITVPFWYGSSGSFWTPDQEAQIWLKIKELLEGTVPKYAQNAQYDILMLSDQMDIQVKNLKMDTMIAANLAYPELPKGLDFLVSLYTKEPYYKDRIDTGVMADYFEYNCLDACCTVEVAQALEKELTDLGLLKFYNEYLNILIQPLLEMSKRGMRIDTAVRRMAIKEYKKKADEFQQELNTLVGRELNVGSPKQMKEWLYTDLKLPKQYKRRSGKYGNVKTLTADEEAIDEFNKTTPRREFDLIIGDSRAPEDSIEALGIRGARKVLSTYLEATTDSDGRMRTSYLISGTDTGRLASRASVHGTGTNFQNIPKGIARRMFIPDPDKVFVSADLSQAEARIVAYLAGEVSLIRLFESGRKIHRKVGADVFRVREDALTDSQYRVAKSLVHASNYGMGPNTFAKKTGVSVSDAKRLQNAYFAAYPGIKLWHLRIKSELQRSRQLSTPMGRKRLFLETLNDNLLKKGYAYIPQSTVSDVVNQGLIDLWKLLPNGADLMLQVHDAIVIQCGLVQVPIVVALMQQCMVRPIRIEGIDRRVRICSIPIEVTTGFNWNDMEDYNGDTHA